MIRQMHEMHKNRKEGNGYWQGIAYNFVIDQEGNVFECRGFEYRGAHVATDNHNTTGIGVQIHVGGNEKPSEKALVACKELYNTACRLTGRTLSKRVHRDAMSTDCPGMFLTAWVHSGMEISAVENPAELTQGDFSMYMLFQVTPSYDEDVRDDSWYLITPSGSHVKLLDAEELRVCKRILSAEKFSVILGRELEVFMWVVSRANLH
jgi:hypothetical protein